MEQFEKISNWAKRSITLKLITIGFLILILLIPLEMVKSLIRERQRNRDSVEQEIFSKWGGRQTLTGPYLSVPCEKIVVTDDETFRYEHNLNLLPESLQVTGSINHEIRSYGIYDAIAYEANLTFKGTFEWPSQFIEKYESYEYHPQNAILSIGITDMLGIQELIKFNFNDTIIETEGGLINQDICRSGVSAGLDISGQKNIEFTFHVKLRGSEALYFVPLGKTTNINLSSDWATPSFTGSYLPQEHSVTDEGFEASWKVLQVSRNYPQTWFDKAFNVDSSILGVKLLFPIDTYQITTRSAKYGLMLIVLTFILFFLIEIFNKKKIHAIQYILVGAGLILFYSLLLSLTEIMSFRLAYSIAAFGIIGVIIYFSLGFFAKKIQSVILGACLTVLYAFLYVVLQVAEYALLIGNVGLFIILFIIMSITKKMNWYKIGKKD